MDFWVKLKIFTICLLLYSFAKGNCFSRFESVAPGMYAYRRPIELEAVTNSETDLGKSIDVATKQLIQDLKQSIISFLDSDEKKEDPFAKFRYLSKEKTVDENLLMLLQIMKKQLAIASRPRFGKRDASPGRMFE